MVKGKGKKLTITFGEADHKGICIMHIRIPISNGFFLTLTPHVVDVDVKLLLGSDLLTKARLIPNFGDYVITLKADG